MKRRGLSIKYKILLLLTLVPLITLALYLFLAIRVFENDKLAYVFESGSAISRSLSQQATADLNSILINATPIIQEYLLQREFGKVTRSVLDSEGKLDWVAVFSNSAEGAYTVSAVAEKIEGMGQRDLQSFGNLEPLFIQMQTQNQSRLIRIPFKDDRVLIMERISDESGTQDSRIFLLMSRLPDLATAFRAPGAAEVFLINEQGLVLFGPGGSEATYLSQKMPMDFLETSKQQKLNAGTEEIQSADGKDLLASFARTSFGDLTVVSLMDKSEALRAVDVLLKRSLVFL